MKLLFLTSNYPTQITTLIHGNYLLNFTLKNLEHSAKLRKFICSLHRRHDWSYVEKKIQAAGYGDHALISTRNKWRFYPLRGRWLPWPVLGYRHSIRTTWNCRLIRRRVHKLLRRINSQLGPEPDLDIPCTPTFCCTHSMDEVFYCQFIWIFNQ